MRVKFRSQLNRKGRVSHGGQRSIVRLIGLRHGNGMFSNELEVLER